MKLKKLLFVSAFALTTGLASVAGPAPNDAKMNKFIDDLMGKMTLEEKNRSVEFAGNRGNCYRTSKK